MIILVGDIIKLSQLDGKDVTVTMEMIDLYETRQAVMFHLEAAAQQKNVTLILKGSRMVITGAEQIIEEMIFNLVDNAIKYNRPVSLNDSIEWTKVPRRKSEEQQLKLFFNKIRRRYGYL